MKDIAVNDALNFMIKEETILPSKRFIINIASVKEFQDRLKEHSTEEDIYQKYLDFRDGFKNRRKKRQRTQKTQQNHTHSSADGGDGEKKTVFVPAVPLQNLAAAQPAGPPTTLVSPNSLSINQQNKYMVRNIYVHNPQQPLNSPTTVLPTHHSLEGAEKIERNKLVESEISLKLKQHEKIHSILKGEIQRLYGREELSRQNIKHFIEAKENKIHEEMLRKKPTKHRLRNSQLLQREETGQDILNNLDLLKRHFHLVSPLGRRRKALRPPPFFVGVRDSTERGECATQLRLESAQLN